MNRLKPPQAGLRKLAALLGEWAELLLAVCLGLVLLLAPPLGLLKLLVWLGWASFSWLKAILFVFIWFLALALFLGRRGLAIEDTKAGTDSFYAIVDLEGLEEGSSQTKQLGQLITLAGKLPSALRDKLSQYSARQTEWLGSSPPEALMVSKPKQVRLGISAKWPPEAITDADILPRNQSLTAGASYYLRIDLSAETTGSNVINPTAIPAEVLRRLPAGALLNVVIESGDFILSKGKSTVHRELRLLKEQASEFLYVRIKAPVQPSVARLSVSVLYRNVRLQWLVTRARVVPAQEAWDDLAQLEAVSAQLPALRQLGLNTVAALAALTDEQVAAHAITLKLTLEELTAWRQSAQTLSRLGNESEVLYTISRTFSDFEDLPGATVSLAFDEAAGLVLIKGATTPQLRAEVNLSNMHPALNDFRALMSALNEPQPEVYGFVNDNRGSAKALSASLLKLAELGRTLYDVICNGQPVQQRLEKLLAAPGTIEIALAPAQNPVPWSALYDLPLLKEKDAQMLGLSRQTCMRWAEPDHQREFPNVEGGVISRPDYQTCRRAADCPRQRRTDQSELAYRDQVGSNICVFGFWGFKHQLQQPAGAVINELPQPAQTLPPQITFRERPQVGIFGNRQIQFYPTPHRQTLEALASLPWQPEIRIADQFQEIRQRLNEDREPHLLYFYCHGDFSDALPALVLGDDNFRLDQSQLEHLQTQWLNQPLVVINGCETATAPPNALMNLATLFNSRQAAGVVGTEIKIFPLLARWFGEEFLKRFLRGAAVGQLMLDLRLELLNRYNPLGLIYTNYSLAGMRLKKADLPAPNARIDLNE
jgi:hypothetical protein